MAILHQTSLLVPFFQQNLLVCLCHIFANSHNISIFFAIVIFVTVICGQFRCYNSLKAQVVVYHFGAVKYSSIKVCTFWGHNDIAHLIIDYSIV